MKIKLETRETLNILCVTETMSLQDMAVLKAGLNRLYQTGKTRIFLDLTSARAADASVITELLAYQASLANADWELGIITPIPETGEFDTVEEVLQASRSPLLDLLLREAKLGHRIAQLDVEKQQLHQELSKQDSETHGNIRRLRRENSDLRNRIKELEPTVARLLRLRPPKPSTPVRDNSGTAKKVILSVLAQEGILSVN